MFEKLVIALLSDGSSDGAAPKIVAVTNSTTKAAAGRGPCSMLLPG